MLASIFGALVTWIEQVVLTMGYTGIVLVMALENVFPPIPSEAIMPLAGWLADTKPEKFNLLLVVVAGMIGSVLGAIILYYIGYFADEPIVRQFLRRWGKFFLLSEDDLDTAVDWFTHYGDWVIFFGRLVPIIRSLISVPAGFKQENGKPMSLPRFLFFTMLGTTIWSFILAFAGNILGEAALGEHGIIMNVLHTYEKAVVALIATAIFAFVGWRAWQFRKRTTSKPSLEQS